MINTQYDYKQIIKDIIEYLKKYTPKNSLYSLSIVGTLADPDHPLEIVNDIDILYIFEDAVQIGKKVRIDTNIYKSVVDLNNAISERFSNRVEIIPSYDCGPFKPIPEKNRIKIELHNLVYTVNRWIREEPIFLYDRARYFSLLYGRTSGSIYNIDNLSEYVVIRDLFGIDHCIQMIETKSIKYCIWEPDPNDESTMKIGVREIDLNEKSWENQCMLVELIFYGVIKSSVNSIRIYTKEVNNYKKDCDAFFPAFNDLESIEFLEVILELKDKYRQGQLTISDDILLPLSERSISYLKNLKVYLLEKHKKEHSLKPQKTCGF